MIELRILPPAAKYIKKLKDKKLKKLYQDAIDEICNNPEVGEPKHGDLEGVLGYDIYYKNINYELAYTVEEKASDDPKETKMIIVILAGTRENFYSELKRYWN